MNISHIKMPERLRHVPCGVVAVLGFCICACLGLMSMLVLADMQTAAFNEAIPEQLVVSMRNVWHALPMFALLSMALLVLGGKKNLTWKAAGRITVAATFLQMALGVWWKSSFKSGPVADQNAFWEAACALAGQRKVTPENIDYLKYWPFQASVGMVGEILARLFNGNYGSWQILSIVCLGGSVALLCCICGRITNSPNAKALCAMLLGGLAALPMYVTFIYGTLPGIMMALLGIYAVIRLCGQKEHALRWWGIALLSFALAIILYTGEQIFLVAAVLILLTTGILNKDQREKIPAALLLLVLTLTLTHAWQAVALHRLGMENEPGCPIWPRIAMGVDAFSNTTPGFYNGLNSRLYYDSGFDPAKANQMAVEHIRTSLAELSGSGQLLKFFCKKTILQWLDPWFGGLTMNNPSIFQEPKWLANAVKGGVLFAPLQAELSQMLSLVYVWAAVGVAALSKRHKSEVWRLSTVVCLIGGFVFQFAAEAKPRYCMPYYLCCFPLTAAGLAVAGQRLAQKSRVLNGAK